MRAQKAPNRNSKHFAPHKFIDLLKSHIRFDDYRLTPFVETEVSKTNEKREGGTV